MNTFQKISCLVFFLGHFSLIIIANLAEIKGLNQEDAIQQFSYGGQQFVSTTTPYMPNHPTATAVKIYTHFAGINTGYCFFSPNVPSPGKVMFELSNPLENTAMQAPILQTTEGRLRFSVNTNVFQSFKDIRELMAFSWAIRMLEYNPEYTNISVVVGKSKLPTMENYNEEPTLLFSESVRYDFQLD